MRRRCGQSKQCLSCLSQYTSRMIGTSRDSRRSKRPRSAAAVFRKSIKYAAIACLQALSFSVYSRTGNSECYEHWGTGIRRIRSWHRSHFKWQYSCLSFPASVRARTAYTLCVMARSDLTNRLHGQSAADRFISDGQCACRRAYICQRQII
jgi:hypothetical protein